MPAESPLPASASFGLIETLLWTHNAGFALFEEHLQRLEGSARHFGFAFSRFTVCSFLENLVQATRHDRMRVRVVLQADGSCEGEVQPLSPPPTDLIWTVTLAPSRFSSTDPLLRHKTTLRSRYEEPLRTAGTDEVIFLNERDEVCEGARSNIFVKRHDTLLTPPLASGLLPGTLRAALLARDEAWEEVLLWQDLQQADEIFMGNSVRGLVPVILISDAETDK